MALNKIQSSEWDKTSSEYSKTPIQGPLIYPCNRMLAKMDAVSSFSSATAILDVGCGPGTVETLLINGYGNKISPSARLIASDYSKGMVDATRIRKEDTIAAGQDVGNCWARLETQVMNAQDLSDVQSNSLSHVIGSLVYFMIPDPRKGLLEAHRVLKEGGVFACTSWTMTIEWTTFVILAAKRAKPDLDFDFTKGIMLEQWTNTEGVKGELEAAGFHSVHSEYVEFDWKLEDPVKHANNMVRSANPGLQPALKQLSEVELDRCCEEYIKIVEEHGNVCKGVAVLGVGRK
ncbi:methyltransferase family protein [Talaromyces proteolyticus]|uniref:Methyltransferase family protein n=1 Tax=Talaromyces proteolyticus TaxID=1131652 RepID=A0AAD4Q4U3_9EURO|nr:methyltransferase family protein [Talaromyces proteolyticus]KAH8703626.1 methyltransferase family protein [Talaromyces proteolyticus]